jgi:hypothetical protein
MTAPALNNAVSSGLIAAAVRLADVLATENAALTALNLPAAARLLPEKLAATDAFTAAQAGARAGARAGAQVGAKEGGAPGRPSAELETVAGRLRELAAENRRLLERAMLVQGRVIATVAKAARATAERTAPTYGARGTARRLAAACAVLTQA